MTVPIVPPPIVIVGAGLAGLTAALALAPLPVLLLDRAPGAQAASLWAQGGIAAAIGPDDSTGLHAADTLEAGAGLSDPAVARYVTDAAPALIDFFIAQGAIFDRDASGALALGLEAAHSRRRIVHAGDATGRVVTQALARRAHAADHITIRQAEVAHLAATDGVVHGVILRDGTAIPAATVILATGGIGGLFAHTTNPLSSWGQGLLLAAQAGAVFHDLEFVQFHPTALDVGRDPMPLVSEAVRGEGATLIDETGTRFMAPIRGAELAARDIVARAVFKHLRAGHRVLLDATACLGTGFAARFPAIAQFCADAGLDPARTPIPVRPAAHYHMGGIATDIDGRTSLRNLFAIGECACTFLHGANRLASNSLLEAGVCATAAAQTIKATRPTTPPNLADTAPTLAADPEPVRPILGTHLGVLRDAAGIETAITDLRALVEGKTPAAGPATVALMLAVSALRRRESRGAHTRTDFPGSTAPSHSRMTLAAERELQEVEA